MIEFRTNENVNLRAFTGRQLLSLFHLPAHHLLLCGQANKHISLEAAVQSGSEQVRVIHLHVDNKVTKWAPLTYIFSQQQMAS